MDHDYIGGPYLVNIPAGQTASSFEISIINDSILENNENFHVFISLKSLLNRVGRVNPYLARITIVDNDGKSLLQGKSI